MAKETAPWNPCIKPESHRSRREKNIEASNAAPQVGSKRTKLPAYLAGGMDNMQKKPPEYRFHDLRWSSVHISFWPNENVEGILINEKNRQEGLASSRVNISESGTQQPEWGRDQPEPRWNGHWGALKIAVKRIQNFLFWPNPEEWWSTMMKCRSSNSAYISKISKIV